MKKTIFMHIGMSKTGTTAIQNMLASNYQLLSKHDLCFPVSCRGYSAHHQLADYFKFGIHKQKARALNSEILMSNQGNFILSSEMFEHMNDDMWARACQFFNAFELKVIVYLRRQDEAITSLYNELVKKHALGDSFSQFIKNRSVLDSLDYTDFLSSIERHIGRRNLSVNVFCKNQLIQGNICRDFMHSIGMPHNLPAPSSTTTNQSLSPAVALMMATINRNTKFDIDHTENYTKACEFAYLIDKELDGKVDTKFAYFDSESARLDFLKVFSDSNGFISEHYMNGRKFSDSPAVNFSKNMSQSDERKLLDEGLAILKQNYTQKYGPVDGVAKMIGVLWKNEIHTTTR